MPEVLTSCTCYRRNQRHCRRPTVRHSPPLAPIPTHTSWCVPQDTGLLGRGETRRARRDRPTFVLLHGLAGSTASWDEVMKVCLTAREQVDLGLHVLFFAVFVSGRAVCRPLSAAGRFLFCVFVSGCLGTGLCRPYSRALSCADSDELIAKPVYMLLLQGVGRRVCCTMCGSPMRGALITLAGAKRQQLSQVVAVPRMLYVVVRRSPPPPLSFYRRCSCAQGCNGLVGARASDKLRSSRIW